MRAVKNPGGPGNPDEAGSYKNQDALIKSSADEALRLVDLDMDAVVDFVKEHGFGSFGEAKRRIAKNINPQGYGSMNQVLERLVEAVILDDMERGKSRAFDRIESSGYKDNAGNQAFLERDDLLSIVLGQPQPHNTIEESIYKPTLSKDSGAKYYRSKATEAAIQNAIDNNLDFASASIAGGEPVSGRHRLKGNTLGSFIVSPGYDREKGLPYISYYDIWDLNPFSDYRSEISRGAEDLAYSALGLESPEVYGRVYFDPSKYDHTNLSSKERLTPEQQKELQRLRGL
jgi:hypothetical protein